MGLTINEQVSFPLTELNSRIRNLKSNGFCDYLNTWERETVYGENDMNHIIMICTTGHYSGWVADIYYSEKNQNAWLQYSKN